MKTKYFILTMLTLLVGIVLSSCSKKDEEERRRRGGSTPSHYVIHEAYNPIAFTLSAPPTAYLDETTRARTPLYIIFKTEVYGEFRRNPQGLKALEALRKRIGDVYRDKPYERGYTPMIKGISNIIIETAEDYNANYPAGSSLAPIASITYRSFDQDIKNALAGNRLSLSELGNQYTRLLTEGIIDCAFPTGHSITVDFTEAPAQPRVNLRVTLVFDDGSRQKRAITTEIHELN